jgi:hypothetical protein
MTSDTRARDRTGQGELTVDLYQFLGKPVQSSAPSDIRDVSPKSGPRTDYPGTVITKVVETTDEERGGLLLGLVAP